LTVTLRAEDRSLGDLYRVMTVGLVLTPRTRQSRGPPDGPSDHDRSAALGAAKRS
jgi:hypothetical protein